MAIWTVRTGSWQRSAHWLKLLSALVYLGLGGERPDSGRRRLGLGAGGGLGWWRSLPEAGASMLCDLGHVAGPPSANPPVMRGKVGQSG